MPRPFRFAIQSFHWELAHRLGSPIPLAGGEVSLDERPTKLSVMELVLPKPRIPLAAIRAAEGGQVYDEVDLVVQPADPGNQARLDVGPVEVCEELHEIRAEQFSTTGAGYGEDADGFSHRLISRRLRQVYNSSGQYLTAVRKEGTTNPARHAEPGRQGSRTRRRHQPPRRRRDRLRPDLGHGAAKRDPGERAPAERGGAARLAGRNARPRD